VAATRPTGRKVQGTIHWFSAPHALDVTLRLYDKAVSLVPDPAGDEDEISQTRESQCSPWCGSEARAEPWRTSGLARAISFERTAYFMSDVIDSKAGCARVQSDRDAFATAGRK